MKTQTHTETSTGTLAGPSSPSPTLETGTGAREARLRASSEERLLLEVERELHTSSTGLLAAAVTPLIEAKSAKRVRPRLLISFAQLAGAPLDHRLVDAACAVELIHSASLLHDDVVDASDVRRGLASANARFGNAAAVLAGDHVLARALRLLAFDARAMSAAVDVVLAMSAAAVCEVEVRGRVDVAVAELEALALGKTGALFGLCGTLAGILANDLDAGAKLEAAGSHLGLAFQCADDVADIASDIRERTPTVPLMRAARDPRVRAELERLWRVERGTAPDLLHATARDRAAVDDAIDDAVDALAARIPPSRADVARHLDVALGALSPWAGETAHDAIAAFARGLAS